MSKPFVIIDKFHEQLETARSGIIPGSYTQAIVSGVQNVATNIKQLKINSASGTCYTTFPLSPLARNCNDLTESFLRFKFNINFQINLPSGAGLGANDYLPLYIGFRDTANLISMIQLMIENNVFYTANYFRQESVLTFNSISDQIKESDPQYATISKLIKHEKCPMKHIVLQGDSTNPTTFNVSLPFNLTIDVSRLSPLISNLQYTTPHFGNLKLKVYFQDVAQALFLSPDLDFISDIPNAVDTSTQAYHVDHKDLHKYYSFYPFNYIATYYDGTQNNQFTYMPLYKITASDTLVQTSKINYFTITNPTSEPFFQMEEADIVQTNFDITESEYHALESLFASNGSIVIPTQTYSTNVFNNSDITAGGSLNKSLVGNIGAYNIDHVSVYFTPQTQSTYFMKHFLKSFQAVIDGKPINAIPYEYLDDRFIKDSIGCLFNDDEDATCHDYLASLNFLNLSGDSNYLSTYTPIQSLSNKFTIYPKLEYPATFSMNFKTNAPSAFHSGACILENSNRQANLRITLDEASNTSLNAHTQTESFPWFITSKTNRSSTLCYFSCLCDCCLVLSYDASRNCCYEAAISWASPFD